MVKGAPQSTQGILTEEKQIYFFHSRIAVWPLPETWDLGNPSNTSVLQIFS